MLSDDRFSELLQSVEVESRPDSVFLDRLFNDLLRERGSRANGKAGFMSSRPIVRYGGLVLGVLVIALVVAILRPGGSPVIPPNGTAAPTSSPAVTASPSPTASPSGSGIGNLCAPCDLEPGTYPANPFIPHFTFTIADPGWSTSRAFSDFGGVVTTDRALYWGRDIRTGVVNGAEVPIGPTPEDLTSFIKTNAGPSVTVGDPQPITIGGIAGTAFDLSNGSSERVDLFRLTVDTFALDPNDHLRLALIEQGGSLVVFFINPLAGTDFQTGLQRLQPLVDSITWEAAPGASASTPRSSPSASAGSAELPLGPLVPGTYENAAGAPFSFTAETGWQVYGDAPTFLQLSDVDDATSSVWFAQAYGFDDAAAAMALWTGQGLVTSFKSATIGGVKGTQFTTVAPKDTVMFGLASDGSDSFGLVTGTAARVFVADMGPTVVTVILEASDAETLTTFAPKADTLLQTVRFGS